VKEFFITASPKVFGGEILGLGNEPVQSFPTCLSDRSFAIALTIFLVLGHRNAALDGDFLPCLD
jgi:hypothetical protein